MSGKDTLESTSALARATLTFMESQKIAATPKNFWIWYEYHRGTHLELVRSLNVVISNKRVFDDALAAEIYDQFFTLGRQDNAIRETNGHVQQTLSQMLEWLSEAEKDTKSYGATLESVSSELASAPGSAGLATMLRRAIVETQAMLERNSTLETHLQSSSQRITELNQNLEEVRREAMTDVLTGIANRKYFDERLKECAREAMEAGHSLCLLFADIDHFKRFNDTWGHQFGDQVLKLVARTLTEGVKGRDTAARYGGEEFAIILPRTSIKDALVVAEHIRRDVASRSLVRRSTGESVGTITLSLGVSRFEPGEPLSDFVERADAALYKAKRDGRNRVVDETALAKPDPKRRADEAATAAAADRA
jgi:diguanylate cyclase